MKNPSWIRKNWLLVAGVTFVGVHLGTYFMQRAAKESVRSQSRDKQRNIEEWSKINTWNYYYHQINVCWLLSMNHLIFVAGNAESRLSFVKKKKIVFNVKTHGSAINEKHVNKIKQPVQVSPEAGCLVSKLRSHRCVKPNHWQVRESGPHFLSWKES